MAKSEVENVVTIASLLNIVIEYKDKEQQQPSLNVFIVESIHFEERGRE